MGKAEDKSAVCRIGRKQRWARYEALGEKENLSPARAWALILVDHYRSVALARPLLQGLAVISKPHGNPLDPLDVQDALGCFAPRAWYIADHHHAYAAALDCFFHAHVREWHYRLLGRGGLGGGAGRGNGTMIECGPRLGKASSAGPVATMLMRRSDRIGGIAPRRAARTTILYAFDLIAHTGEEPRDRPVPRAQGGAGAGTAQYQGWHCVQ